MYDMFMKRPLISGQIFSTVLLIWPILRTNKSALNRRTISCSRGKKGGQMV